MPPLLPPFLCDHLNSRSQLDRASSLPTSMTCLSLWCSTSCQHSSLPENFTYTFSRSALVTTIPTRYGIASKLNLVALRRQSRI